MNSQQRIAGFVLAIFAAITWGVSGTFGQFLFSQRGINPGWLVTLRLLVAGSILLMIALFRGLDLWKIWSNKRDTLLLLAFSVLGMVAVQYTYFEAIHKSNAATATVLQYMGPVFIAIYMAFKQRRLPNFIEFVAIILALSGTFLLVTHGRFGSLAISTEGLLWGIASAVALAIYSLLPVGLMNRYEVTTVIGWAMFVGGIIFSCVFAPWKVSGTWDSQSFAYTGFILLLGSLAAFYAFLKAVTIVGAQTSSLLACAEPLSSTAMAIFWLNTPFGKIDMLGSFMIMLTIGVLALFGRKN